MAQELLAARTAFSKVFDEGRGRRRLHVCAAPLHYQDARGQWQDIDLDNPAVGFRMERAPYTVDIRPDAIGMRYRSKAAGADFSCDLVQIDGHPIATLPLRVQPVRRDRTILWEECLPGVTIGLRLGRRAVSFVKQLRDASAPRSFTWRVTSPSTPSGLSLMAAITGHDNVYRDPIDGRTVRSVPLELRLDRQIVSDDGAVRVEDITETWTGRLLNGGAPVYPVEFDPSFQEAITIGTDDGDEYPVGTWNAAANASDARVGSYYSNASHGGFRFAVGDGTGPASGATIDSATLTIETIAQVGSPDIDIYADDVDNAAAWSSTSRPSQITPTTAKADWNPVALGSPYTVNVTAVVQEIVNRAGWAQGNAIRFAFLNQGTGNNFLRAATFENPSVVEMRLDITYTAGGGGAALSVVLEEPSVTVTVF